MDPGICLGTNVSSDSGKQREGEGRVTELILPHRRHSARAGTTVSSVNGLLIQSGHLLLSHVERQELNISDVICYLDSGGSRESISLNQESLY